ncbi:aldo/keto reductase [Thalassotalea euphylliae]|uniref:Aldo/keto reductase n=1 Tax=Thalassotalea euphylliae TaxID=1655234 RepID=A0A3E0TWH9_9GAMM|nr:aldo/keto reductase [Thalassotalea euphylliae]REL28996.1 aldo/keto reductase [Thalassotalea euphylliae]
MKKLSIHQHLPAASQIISGCMGLGGHWDQQPYSKAHVYQAQQLIETSLAHNINYFDHADIYTFGKAEQAFGQVLAKQPDLRAQMIIQSKCAIRFEDSSGPKRYDFSNAWVTQSVDGILSRLGIEYLDVLQLHRPDPLMELAELAACLTSLKASGKVKHFGVSNMNHHQIAYLQSALDMPIVANQIEMSLKQLGWLEHGVLAGNPNGSHHNFCAGTLEHCQLNGVQIQSWGSLAQGIFSGRAIDSQSDAANGHATNAEKIRATAALVATLAAQYQTPPDALVLAWLMRHPANIQPIIGTTNPERISRCAEAVQIELSRAHWYQLYVTARGAELP